MGKDEVAVTDRNKHLQYDGRRGAVEHDAVFLGWLDWWWRTTSARISKYSREELRGVEPGGGFIRNSSRGEEGRERKREGSMNPENGGNKTKRGSGKLLANDT